MIVPADLPLINTLDIEAVLDAGKDPPVVVISPDRHRQGTNTMLVSPPGLFKYRYGSQSFREHSALALENGARLEICDRPALALDLDLPEDVELVRKQINLFDSGELEKMISTSPWVDSGKNGNDRPVISPCLDVVRAVQMEGQDDSRE